MSNADLRSNLQQLYKELSVLELAYATKKILFYKPIGQQPDFHGADTAAIRLVLGSNRSGKSVAGVAEAIAHSLGYRPWLPEDHPDRTVRLTNGEPIPVPNIGRVIAQNAQQAIKQTIWPKWEEWAPRGWYSVKRDNRGIPTEITWKNGSKVYFMSNEQDDMAFEGTNGHWFWGDEPFDYRKYTGLRRGLVDYDGHCWITMTPLTQPWIHDVIVSRVGDPDGSVKMFKFSIWDNCRENGGHLSRSAIEEFLSDLREDELEARLHGNFLHLAGRVFKEWEPEPPYWIEPYKIPASWPRVCVIDPHPRKPVAVLWAAVSPDDQLVVYRDLYDQRLRTISQVSDKIKELEGWYFANGEWRRGDEAEVIAHRIIDNSAQEQERTSGDTIARRFARESLPCELAKKHNAQAGFDAIHDALQTGKYEWDEPGLVVFNNCRYVKQNFLNFVWDSWQTDKQRDLKGDKQEVRKHHDDFIDCIRYIYQAQLDYRMLKRNARLMAERDDDFEFNGVNVMEGVRPPQTRRQRKWQTSSVSDRSRGSSSRAMRRLSTIRTTPRTRGRS
jgi:hypothetical protein